MINAKKIKEIKRWGKLRFKGVPTYNPIIILRIYQHADKEKRIVLDREMKQYMWLIENKKIKPGDSMLKASLGDLEMEIVESDPNQNPETI